MASNPYDFSFVLRKKLQRKIFNIFMIFLTIFLIINLILFFVIFPHKVSLNAMNPEYENNSIVFVAPCNFEKPLFYQKYDINRGSVVYLDSQYEPELSYFQKAINNICGFFTLRKFYPFESKNLVTEKSTLRRVIGLPGDTLYIENYVVYIKPKGSQHYLTEFELADRMYETIVQVDEIINPSIGAARQMEEIILADDEYFLLADNRVSSVDSRLYGPVNLSEIKGKAILRFYPFSSFDALL